MKYNNRHIIHLRKRYSCCTVIWLLSLLLCLSACSSGGDAIQTTDKKSNTNLYVYVYAPQEAQSTRAYEGDVNPTTNEAKVYSMQIWVFTHDTHQLLGHYASIQPPNLTTINQYELIQISIEESYAETPANERENVDVYVAANVEDSNCNLTLDALTTQAQLEDALIEKTTVDPFGMTTPISVVPESIGLPMSGVLRNVPVVGDAPVLRLDDSGEIATVQLIRAISKLRFAFSRRTGGETLQVNSIKLNTEMLPIAEHIFMADGAPYDRHTCHIKTESGYDTTTPNLLSEPITEIADNANPVYYAWANNELAPIDYEQRIEDGARNGYLTQRYFYLRESDKLIQGEIKYQVNGGEEQTATFTMQDVGGFSRNHVWTVYSYLAEANLKVIVAETAPWRQTEENYEFYNW